MCYLPSMADIETNDEYRETLKGLLSRGGTVLTLAVLARAGSQEGRHAVLASLTPEMRAATEQVGRVLETAYKSEALKAALEHALSLSPAVALPDWLRPVLRNSRALSHLGASFNVSDLRSALGRRRTSPSDREKGIAALATALCRQQDTLSTLAGRFPEEREGALLLAMGRLAAVTASPGEPSTVRGTVRRILKEGDKWDV